ncbi:unnamed protein product [Orchesella dallaii]|uniref:O-acyltransferase WSD1 C-terminal domain-containing protein n=1 Tax=Orchesella dallaii TaxID=48710 RepID=A0ABP1Q0S4_9HEXA
MKNRNIMLNIGYHIFCICTSLIVLPSCALLFGTLYLVREVINTFLKCSAKGRFKLAQPIDAVCSTNLKYTVCGYIRPTTNQISLEELRKRISENPEFCSGPYKKLKYRPCTKFGFACWEDVSSKFDINEHIKYFPGTQDKILTENEMKKLLTEYVNISKLTKNERPAWEFLVMPQVRMKSELDGAVEIYFVFIFQLDHGYMDGNCCQRFLKQCVMDPDEEIRVPVDLIKTQGNEQRLLIPMILPNYRLFIYGPARILQTIFFNRKSVHFTDKQKTAGSSTTAMFARSKLNMSSLAMNRIRVAYGCHTRSVIISTFLTALHKFAEDRGLRTPPYFKVGFAHAKLPYPNDEPQNRFCLIVKRLPLKDQLETQLREIDKILKITPKSKHELDFGFSFITLLGLLPVFIIRFVKRAVTVSTCGISGVPSVSKFGTIQNGVAETIFGIPPLVDGVDYTCAYNNYGNISNILLLMRSTPLLENEHDVRDFVVEFDNCLRELEQRAKGMQLLE